MIEYRITGTHHGILSVIAAPAPDPDFTAHLYEALITIPGFTGVAIEHRQVSPWEAITPTMEWHPDTDTAA